MSKATLLINTVLEALKQKLNYQYKEEKLIEMNVDWNDLKESGTYEIKGFFWDEENLAPLTDSYEDMGTINVEQSV